MTTLKVSNDGLEIDGERVDLHGSLVGQEFGRDGQAVWRFAGQRPVIDSEAAALAERFGVRVVIEPDRQYVTEIRCVDGVYECPVCNQPTTGMEHFIDQSVRTSPDGMMVGGYFIPGSQIRDVPVVRGVRFSPCGDVGLFSVR